MASTSAADVREELINCSICLQKFTRPRTLRCLHTFCEMCLEKCLDAYLQRTRKESNERVKLPCPTCREETPLPEKGIAGLKADFKIAKIADLLNVTAENADDVNGGRLCSLCKIGQCFVEARYHCKECSTYFCKKCVVHHTAMKVFTGHLVQDLRVKQKARNFCGVHQREVLQFYCHHCKINICCLCVMTKHRKHRLTDWDKVKERRRARASNLNVHSKTNPNMHHVKCNRKTCMKEKLHLLKASLQQSYAETSDMKKSGFYNLKLRNVRKQLRKSYQLTKFFNSF